MYSKDQVHCLMSSRLEPPGSWKSPDYRNDPPPLTGSAAHRAFQTASLQFALGARGPLREDDVSVWSRELIRRRAPRLSTASAVKSRKYGKQERSKDCSIGWEKDSRFRLGLGEFQIMFQSDREMVENGRGIIIMFNEALLLLLF